jgi:hypothetical protein
VQFGVRSRVSFTRQWRGHNVLTMLRAAGAEWWVAPPVARFVGADGSLQ